MSTRISDIKWGSVVASVIVALVIAIVGLLVVQVVAVTARGFQLRGTPPQEEQIAILTGIPVRIAGLILTVVGAWAGGRRAGRSAEDGQQLNGLIVGILTAVLRMVWDLTSIGAFSVWTVLHLLLGVAGGWFGGWLASRSAETET
jgi:hypothetical protein